LQIHSIGRRFLWLSRLQLRASLSDHFQAQNYDTEIIGIIVTYGWIESVPLSKAIEHAIIASNLLAKVVGSDQ
jgi:hypothetical protein